MKKRILIFLSVLAVVLTLIALMVVTASAEEKKITISYLNSYNPMNPDPGFDKNAYENGQQIVDNMKSQIDEIAKKGESIQDKKKVYFEIAPAPNLYSFGNSTFLNEMIELALESIIKK